MGLTPDKNPMRWATLLMVLIALNSPAPKEAPK